MTTTDRPNLTAAGQALLQKLDARAATCGVIGLGYVGLPLVVELAHAGFDVVGIDVDQGRIDALNKGESYIGDVPSDVLRPLVEAGKVRAGMPGELLGECDTISICVPTPLRKSKDPDISYIVSASQEVVRHLRAGQLIILESTTYPGTTEEVILPELRSTGLEVGADIFLAFSPERVDPGNPVYNTKNTPKVVGGVTPACSWLAHALYSSAIDTVVRVSSPSAAEMVKLLENTFRSVNIGLVNEVAIMCRKLGCDVWEVIEAAATKPFGFQAFYPGPGLGGHCIPIDPFYLAWKARELGHTTRFIELAGEINSQMPEYVVAKVAEALNTRCRPIRDSKILILGIAYKPDVEDMRESPAATIIELLMDQGADVSYHDPHCPNFPEMRQHDIDLNSVSLDESTLSSCDCVLIVTDHSNMDYGLVGRCADLIVDTRNAMDRVEDVSATVIKA
ncbi:MAG: nucleotide sugar dehydrogenase [Planctomycetota bacterium]|nr:nucleotide sugar dehydrogenase [Planctomycetota bacterium]